MVLKSVHSGQASQTEDGKVKVEASLFYRWYKGITTRKMVICLLSSRKLMERQGKRSQLVDFQFCVFPQVLPFQFLNITDIEGSQTF